MSQPNDEDPNSRSPSTCDSTCERTESWAGWSPAPQHPGRPSCLLELWRGREASQEKGSSGDMLPEAPGEPDHSAHSSPGRQAGSCPPLPGPPRLWLCCHLPELLLGCGLPVSKDPGNEGSAESLVLLWWGVLRRGGETPGLGSWPSPGHRVRGAGDSYLDTSPGFSSRGRVQDALGKPPPASGGSRTLPRCTLSPLVSLSSLPEVGNTWIPFGSPSTTAGYHGTGQGILKGWGLWHWGIQAPGHQGA